MFWMYVQMVVKYLTRTLLVAQVSVYDWDTWSHLKVGLNAEHPSMRGFIRVRVDMLFSRRQNLHIHFGSSNLKLKVLV